MLLLIVHQKITPGKNTSIIRRAWFLNAQPKHFKKNTSNNKKNWEMEKSNIRMKYDAKKQEKEKEN